MDETFRSLPARFVFLIAAILIYAFLGSPTPDHPGWVEVIIGGLFILAAGAGVVQAFTVIGAQFWHKVLFIFGMTVPLIVGTIKGYDVYAIARDMVAFLFLCLPLFFYSLVNQTQTRKTIFTGSLVVLGLVFALRALAPAYDYAEPSGELYYLSNAPTVLFAAIFMGGVAINKIGGPLTLRQVILTLCAVATVLIIIWAMLLDIQRATIFSIILSIGLFLILLFIRAPRRVIIPFMAVGILIAVFMPVFQDAVHAMAEKTARVGLNMRLEEIKTVLDTIGGSVSTALFGMGWGVKMASPAVGGVEVAFTHSLLSYMLLKTGLCGLGLTLIFIAASLRNIVSIGRRDAVMGVALFWALIIPVFLYASHKSLDYGLILLLIAVLADGLNGRVASTKAAV
jgi:hypothetical protein